MKNSRLLISLLLLLCTTVAAVAQSYTLKYNVDGKDYAIASLAQGEAITYPAAPSKAGHTFLGWSTSTNLVEIDLASNADAMLYSNAKCKVTQYGDQFTSWDVLFDGSDDTFFHSDYSGADSEDGLDHYLRVDMGAGNAVTVFQFNYQNRNKNCEWQAPATIVVEGSNEANGQYTTIAILSDLPTENSATYESPLLGNGNAYRYIRLRVTATNNGDSKGGHVFFFISELAMYQQTAPATMPANDLTLYARFKKYECDIEQDGIFYNILDHETRTVEVTGSQLPPLNLYTGALDIPATVTYEDEVYTVVGVESGLFHNNATITSISIPASFGTIEDNMFIGSTALTKVTIAEGVTAIGAYAFKNCEALTSITIPTSVTTIGDGAFQYCSSITSFSLPNTITVIEDYMFWGCTNLAEITIPNSVTNINRSAFCYCSSLKSINIPDKVTSIEFEVFHDCYSLESIVFGNGLTNIGQEAFYRCDNLKEIAVPNGVTTIGINAFGECTNLASIELPRSITSIGNSAFYKCDNLKSIINFTKFTFVAGSTDYGMIAKNATNIINIPNGFAEGDYKFSSTTDTNTLLYYFGNESELVLPANCNGEDYEIGAEVFASNTTITSITIPVAVTAIGASAFEGCTNLATVHNFSELTLEAGSEEHGSVALYASNIINAPNGSIEGDFVFAKTGGVNTLIMYLGNDTELTLPQSYNGEEYAVGEGVFAGNADIESISIPAAVTAIGNEAFNGCTSLAELRIEDGEETLTLGYNAYNETEDGKGLFADCPLVTLYLGRNLEYPEQGCYGYSPLMNKETLTNVTIGEYVIHINSSLLCFSTNITHLVIPGNVKNIGTHAFGACYKLTDLTIGEGVETLGNDAFNSCTSLVNVTIPASVTSIGDAAFIYCLKLADITSLATTPATVGNNTFYHIATGATLYVPRDCRTAYAATQWRKISNIVELAFNVIYKVNGTVYATERYDYGAAVTPIADPELQGYRFIEWEGVPDYMPRHDVEVNAVVEQVAAFISINQYGTTVYASEYALDFSKVEGLRAYTATGYNSVTGEITMTRVKTSKAGLGLYLVGEPNTTYIVPFIECSNDNSLNMLVGVLKKQIVNAYTDDGRYANYKYTIKSGDAAPKFYQYGDGSSVSAGKAYLQIPVAWFEGMASETVGIRFDEGELTDIDEIEGEIEAENVKSKTIYDLQGRSVENPTHGIYIIDGKKVFIK